jgi:prepilin-type N-terminal cleavage/methylation domain-containing protein
MQTANIRRRSSQAGITMIELLISMIILGIVSTMLITGWINLQRASAFTVKDNNARADARDGLSRMTTELRDAQPTSLPTTTASPTATPMPSPTWSIYTVAGPWEVDFYSAYNTPGAGADGSGTGKLLLTRFYLDQSGTSDQKTLYWQRDTNSTPGFDAGDRKFVVAHNVVNMKIPDPSTGNAYTAIFTYGYRNSVSGQYLTTDNSAGTLDLTTVIAVQIRLITDVNLSHAPKYIDLSTTVRPRNATAN